MGPADVFVFRVRSACLCVIPYVISVVQNSLEHNVLIDNILFVDTACRRKPTCSGQIFATVFYAALPRRNVWCSAIFAGAALTDWLDGYIARKQGIVTPFGAFLDPVADKVTRCLKTPEMWPMFLAFMMNCCSVGDVIDSSDCDVVLFVYPYLYTLLQPLDSEISLAPICHTWPRRSCRSSGTDTL